MTAASVGEGQPGVTPELAKPGTWVDLVRDVGSYYGHWIDDDEADAILWNWTGYPGFFHGDPAIACRLQLHEFFQGVAS